MQIRHANEVHTVNDADGRQVSQTKTFKLGHWEMWKLQEAIDLLPEDDKVHMEYFAHVIGSCENVSVTIEAKYEI